MKRFTLSIVILCSIGIAAAAQTTEFTYQGILNVGTPPTLTTVNYDFEFGLFSIDTGGSAIATLQRLNVPVSNGTFSVKLDFGSPTPCPTCFDGSPRWLEIAVRPAGSGGFQILLPRQAISSTPYSITASNALKLGGTAANQYLLTNGNGSALTNLNAGNISTGTLAIANGGTGSATKNFVDLSSDQPGIGGNKTFTGNLTVQSNNPVTGALDVGSRSRFRQNTGSIDTTNSAGFWLYQNVPAADQPVLFDDVAHEGRERAV